MWTVPKVHEMRNAQDEARVRYTARMVAGGLCRCGRERDSERKHCATCRQARLQQEKRRRARKRVPKLMPFSRPIQVSHGC